nr:oligosaccharide flippase family protein [Ruegeria sp. HKCCA4008]
MKPPVEPGVTIAPGTPDHSATLTKGAATLFASGVFSQFLGVLTLVVTARLLTPTDFGIIAYFIIAAAFLEIVQRAVSMILIRQPEITDDHLNTVFTMQVLLGIFSALLIWASAPLMTFFGLAELTSLIPALCFIAIASSIKSTRFPLLERDLRFGFIAGEEATSRIAYTLMAISLTWFWRDYWAIVIAYAITQAIRVIWSFSVAPMRPRLTLRCWHDCIDVSSWSLGAQITQFLINNMPQIVIGSSLGLADAGIFRVGYRLVIMFTSQIIGPLERVVYPSLANTSRTRGSSREAFEQVNAVLLGIIVPASVGMALVANHLIVVVAGYQWLAAAQVIWVLAPLKAIETLQANVRSASYVEGSTKRLFVRNTILLIATTALTVLGSSYGFTGAILGSGAASLFAIGLALSMAKDFGSGGFLTPILMAWRTFVSTFVMLLAVLFVSSAYGSGDAVGWAYETAEDLPLLRIRFSIKVLVGVFVYVGTHLLLWRLAGKPKGFESLALDMAAKAKSRFIPAN